MQYKCNKAFELNRSQGSKEMLPYMLHNTYWNTDSNDLETRGLSFPLLSFSEHVLLLAEDAVKQNTEKLV